MTAESAEDTYWAIDSKPLWDEPCCEIVAVTRDEMKVSGSVVFVFGRGAFLGDTSIFHTEQEAISHALERAERLAGYWERQTDQLRRRLHEIAVRGENA